MPTEKPVKLVPPAGQAGQTIAPFDPSRLADEEPQFDVNPFTPRQRGADDPPPAQGINLSGKNNTNGPTG